MNKLPVDFDGSFLLGRCLELLSFTVNTVTFIFDYNISITVEGSLQHEVPGWPSPIQRIPVVESKMMELLGKCVVGATGELTGTITIQFENGHLLRVFDDSEAYESYVINDGARQIIV